MKIPISWLKEYVDFEDSARELAEKLTFSGMEVEVIHTVGSSYTDMIVGEIVGVEKHPHADRLSLCHVFDGRKNIEVVCGAPNVKAGLKGALAPVGSTLANGVKIKKAQVRGIVSSGMLCAEDELGLSDDHEGILIIEDAYPAGTPLADVLGPPETVLELEITPNRPDCLSMIGIAREVAALYGSVLRKPAVAVEESNEKIEGLTRVDIKDAEGCARYTARMIKHIAVAPSPPWMQKRLSLAGIRPINNIVDITNYVLLECGQPLHAFDQHRLAEERIVVRIAKPGERIETLDGAERALDSSMTVIADADRPVAVAGVMGGMGSEIVEQTHTVLLESACFNPSRVRKTSKQLGLSTDSSYRFERGVDVEQVEWASRRAAALMAELANGTPVQGVIDRYPRPIRKQHVTCRWARINNLLGTTVDPGTVKKIFGALGLTIIKEDETSCTVEPPTFRLDLEREVDLIEEVARIHGLDKIPAPSPHARIVPDAYDRRSRAIRALRQHLVGLGLREIFNYSLLSKDLLAPFELDNEQRRIQLPNPISADQSILRPTLIPQMTESLGHNKAHQIPEAHLFEVGRVYTKGEQGYCEPERMSLGFIGADHTETAFLRMKGILENLFAVHHIVDYTFVEYQARCFATGKAVSIILEGEPIGYMGLLSSALREKWRFTGPVPLAELDVKPFLSQYQRIHTLSEIPKYPPITRDISIIVDKTTKHIDLVNLIYKSGPKELEKVELFDIFHGQELGDDKKGMAYSLHYRAMDGSLTDEQANAYHERIKADIIRKALNVEIREG